MFNTNSVLVQSQFQMPYVYKLGVQENISTRKYYNITFADIVLILKNTGSIFIYLFASTLNLRAHLTSQSHLHLLREQFRCKYVLGAFHSITKTHNKSG